LYSIGGDMVHFSAKEALYYQWYLVTSENTYQGFADADSEQQFEQLKQFIADGSHFRVVATKVLPDGSSLTLYRQL
jgi:4'-phosphopantetheinyl transferase EntD